MLQTKIREPKRRRIGPVRWRASSFVPILCKSLPLLLTAQAAISVTAAPVHFESGTNRVALLEIYTSEGCSSCPPAEEWLSQFKSDPRLWRELVPVAFHVDYWDYLGWRDPFGAPAYSSRQRALATAIKSESVYTPGFVLDGAEWRGWFRRDRSLRLPPGPAGKLEVRSEDGLAWRLHHEPVGPRPPARVVLHAALLGFDLVNDVKAGENRGRKLQHDFVVLSFAERTAKRTDAGYEDSLVLPPANQHAPKRLAVAAWVTALDNSQPLQAVGGWLPSIPQ